MLLNEAIAKFKTWKSMDVKTGTIKGYDMILRQFALYCKNCDLEATTIEDIMDWFELMKTLSWDHNSFIPKAMALRKFFEFYYHQKYQVIDPWLIPIPSKEVKVPKVATPEYYQRLLAIIPKQTNDPRHIRNLSIINLLWDTGARNGEILSLNLPDINLDSMKAIIKTEKSKGWRPIREIFWTKETNQNLIRWIDTRTHLVKVRKCKIQDPSALFISLSGSRYDTMGRRLTMRGVGELIRHYCIKAKIPYMSAHSFRHHMGHYIIKKGGSTADVMNILGHASMQSSAVYTMMVDKELEERYRLFKGE